MKLQIKIVAYVKQKKKYLLLTRCKEANKSFHDFLFKNNFFSSKTIQILNIIRELLTTLLYLCMSWLLLFGLPSVEN